MTMRHLFGGIAFAAMPVALLAASPGVTVDRAAQARLGIVTAPLAAATRRPSITSFAHVLDPTPLMTLDSDIEIAAATAAASAAESRRAQALAAADATVARKAAEAAAAQARGDAARLLLLRRRLTLEWGSAIASLPARRRAALLADVAGGRSALLRIDAPPGGSFAAIRLVSVDAGDGRIATARLLGDSRAADPRQAVAGKLAIVVGAPAGRMAIGLTMPARLAEGAATTGVLVPSAAVLRQQGKSWAYLRRGPVRFDRVPLTGAIAQSGGLIVANGPLAGDSVVIRGAAQLYTAEQASVSAGE